MEPHFPKELAPASERRTGADSCVSVAVCGLVATAVLSKHEADRT